jgi:Tfp pilus assembly protein PilO
VTRTNKILIAVIAMAGALGAFWHFALAPKREQAAKLDENIVAKQAELQNARQNLATYEKARAGYPTNYATVVRLGKAVPDDDDMRSLLVQLDSAAGGTGVDFRTIQVGGAGAAAPTSAKPADPANPLPPGAVSVGTAGFAAMPFSFSFRGSFENLSSFFSRLERFVTVRNERMNVTGRLLRLETIDLQVDQSGFPRIRAQIGANSYLVPSEQGLTAGATPQGPAGTETSTAAAPASGDGPAAPTTTATVTGATP